MTLLDKLLSSFIEVTFASKYFPVHPFSLLYYYSYTSLVLSTMQKKNKNKEKQRQKSQNTKTDENDYFVGAQKSGKYIL